MIRKTNNYKLLISKMIIGVVSIFDIDLNHKLLSFLSKKGFISAKRV